MYTLEDVYNKIVNGTTSGSHSLIPLLTPRSTMHTLTDIYTSLPANDQICSGTNAGTATCGGGGTSTGIPPLVWSDDQNLTLCWSPSVFANGCWTDGFLDPTGTGDPLFGAFEYCKYLKQDKSGLNCSGTPTTCAEVNYWRLPTESELLAGLSDQFSLKLSAQTGFRQDVVYWSGTMIIGSSNNVAWDAQKSSSGYSNTSGETSNHSAVRCVHGGLTTASCGNGLTEFAEQCDDGNNTDGDGCSSICQQENLWICDGTPSSCYYNAP